MPHELIEIKKIILLKCCLLLFYSTTNHFLIGLWHMTKVDFLWQGLTSSSGWTDWEDALDQSQTRTERAWSLSGGLLQVWSTTAFRILAKSLHLRSLLRKLMRYTVNFNVCSWQWSTESAQFFSASYWTLHNHCFKSWTNWAKKFCPICHIHLTTWIPLLQASWQLFAGKTLPTTSRM